MPSRWSRPALIVGLICCATACGPSIDEGDDEGGADTEADASPDGESESAGSRGPVQTPLYNGSPDTGSLLVCIPVDEGCLRLSRPDPQTPFEGERVGANCHAGGGTPVFAADVVTWLGHGALGVVGQVTLEDGTVYPLDVTAQNADSPGQPPCE